MYRYKKEKEQKDVRMLDIVINYLGQNRKSIKKYEFPSWNLLKELEE